MYPKSRHASSPLREREMNSGNTSSPKKQKIYGTPLSISSVSSSSSLLTSVRAAASSGSSSRHHAKHVIFRAVRTKLFDDAKENLLALRRSSVLNASGFASEDGAENMVGMCYREQHLDDQVVQQEQQQQHWITKLDFAPIIPYSNDINDNNDTLFNDDHHKNVELLYVDLNDNKAFLTSTAWQ